MNEIIRVGSICRIESMRVLDDYRLFLTFADGKKGVYDAKPLLKHRIYEALKSPGFFKTAKTDGGCVFWNDDVDIAPELLYENSVPVEETP